MTLSKQISACWISWGFFVVRGDREGDEMVIKKGYFFFLKFKFIYKIKGITSDLYFKNAH